MDGLTMTFAVESDRPTKEQILEVCNAQAEAHNAACEAEGLASRMTLPVSEDCIRLGTIPPESDEDVPLYAVKIVFSVRRWGEACLQRLTDAFPVHTSAFIVRNVSP